MTHKYINSLIENKDLDGLKKEKAAVESILEKIHETFDESVEYHRERKKMDIELNEEILEYIITNINKIESTIKK